MDVSFYHICSSGTYNSLMFRSDSDFITWMNDLLVCATKHDIDIYAFCLMNNHFHFLVRGNYQNARKFAQLYLQRRIRLIRKKYCEIKYASDIDLSIKVINNLEYLRGVCGYILRNPMSAGMNVIPTAYPWSSANLYFKKPDSYVQERQLSSLGIRRQRELFYTKELLPQDLFIDNNDMIYPAQYVKVTELEQLFLNPRQFSFYLSKNNDVEFETDSGILKSVKFRDDELFQSLEEISKRRFDSEYKNLSVEKRCLATIEMAKKFRVTTTRASRISSLPPNLLAELLGR